MVSEGEGELVRQMEGEGGEVRWGEHPFPTSQ